MSSNRRRSRKKDQSLWTTPGSLPRIPFCRMTKRDPGDADPADPMLPTDRAMAGYIICLMSE